jgi:hypothetical protein
VYSYFFYFKREPQLVCPNRKVIKYVQKVSALVRNQRIIFALPQLKMNIKELSIPSSFTRFFHETASSQ